MMGPLAGKHDQNEDEFGAQLVHAVFAEKSYANIFEIYCEVLEFPLDHDLKELMEDYPSMRIGD